MANRDLSGIRGRCQGTNEVAVLEVSAPAKAKDIAKYGVATVAQREPVYEAIRLLVQNKISCLPVVRGTDVVGMIAEKDILRLLREREFLAGLVEDYMTENVVCFDVEDDAADICNCLVNNDFRSVPMLYQGRLVGIISRADFIRVHQDRFRGEGPEAGLARSVETPIAEDIMACGLLTVKPQTPMHEAMRILATRSVTGLPVVDDLMNLLGIISEKDALRLLHDPAARPGNVEDFMTRDVVGLNHDESVLTICECLAKSNFRRVPILKQGKVVGIISRADVILYILRNRYTVFGRKHSS